MKGPGECHDGMALRYLASQLERGFHGIRAGWPGELDLVVQPAWHEHEIAERLQETGLSLGHHVKTVNDAVARQVLHELGLQEWIIVAVVQCAGSSEKVEVGAVVRAIEHGPGAPAEHDRPVAGVAAHG
jgi:hypothetical protein